MQGYCSSLFLHEEETPFELKLLKLLVAVPYSLIQRRKYSESLFLLKKLKCVVELYAILENGKL